MSVLRAPLYIILFLIYDLSDLLLLVACKKFFYSRSRNVRNIRVPNLTLSKLENWQVKQKVNIVVIGDRELIFLRIDGVWEWNGWCRKKLK